VETMHYVTYKNILKEDKGKSDFMKWLKLYWPIVQNWGATSFKLWNQKERGRHILFCQYAVQNLEQWNNAAMNPSAGDLIRALSDIVELDKMSIRITAPYRGKAN
jgi:hypothetical protein